MTMFDIWKLRNEATLSAFVASWGLFRGSSSQHTRIVNLLLDSLEDEVNCVRPAKGSEEEHSPQSMRMRTVVLVRPHRPYWSDLPHARRPELTPTNPTFHLKTSSLYRVLSLTPWDGSACIC